MNHEDGAMPGELLRDNFGVVISAIGFLYGVLAGAIGWMSRRLAKLRDHDEDIRRLTLMQSDTAQILACMRNDHVAEVKERREEDGRIYARVEAIGTRYDEKFDALNKSIHEVGLKVERAMVQRRNES